MAISPNEPTSRAFIVASHLSPKGKRLTYAANHLGLDAARPRAHWPPLEPRMEIWGGGHHTVNVQEA